MCVVVCGEVCEEGQAGQGPSVEVGLRRQPVHTLHAVRVQAKGKGAEETGWRRGEGGGAVSEQGEVRGGGGERKRVLDWWSEAIPAVWYSCGSTHIMRLRHISKPAMCV